MPDVGNSQSEEESLGIVQSVVARSRDRGGLGWIFRRLPNPDYGIDGHIEVIGRERDDKGGASGRLLSVQVKGGQSYFRYDRGDHWIVYIDKDTVQYWRSHSLPVIVVLVNLVTSRCYWARGDAEHRETATRYAIRVPKTQILSPDAIHSLQSIANDLDPILAKLASLTIYAPIMERVDNGERLVMTADRYGASSGYLYNISLAFDGGFPEGTEVAWEADDATEDIHALFPWATLTVAFDSADPYDDYLSEECPWDSEDGQYIDVGHYDEWIEARTLPDGSVLFNGEPLQDGSERYHHIWEVGLSDLGTSFLRIWYYIGE